MLFPLTAILLLVFLMSLLIGLRYLVGSSLLAVGVVLSLGFLALGSFVFTVRHRPSHRIHAAHEMVSLSRDELQEHTMELRRKNERFRIAWRDDLEAQSAMIEWHPDADATGKDSPLARSAYDAGQAGPIESDAHQVDPLGDQVDEWSDEETREKLVTEREEWSSLDRDENADEHSDEAARADANERAIACAVEAARATVERAVEVAQATMESAAEAARQAIESAAELEDSRRSADFEEGVELSRHEQENERVNSESEPDAETIEPAASAAPAESVADLEPPRGNLEPPVADIDASPAEPAAPEANPTAPEIGAIQPEPGTMIDANAPAWVTQPMNHVNGQPAVVIESDPFDNRFDCDEDLERRTRQLIHQAARRRCRHRGLPEDLVPQIGYDEIDMVSRERHYQTRTTSLGEMVQAYQLTVMDEAFQAKLDRRLAEALAGRRLATTGMLSGTVLLGVSTLFGAFRFAARKSTDPMRIS